ncbi:hypothetical protein GKZ67_00900 [Hymenobacter sp. BRD67]|nr:hypothetical protein GKZ67_00900 [Hymenobacter sp. BRD67]
MTAFYYWLVATLRQVFLGRPVGLVVLLLVSLVSQAGLPSARRLPPNGQLAAGSAHSLLVRPDGSLYAWGANGSGQLGNGSTSSSSTPVAVSSGLCLPAPAWSKWRPANCFRWPWPPMALPTPGATMPAASSAIAPRPPARCPWR